MHYMAGSRKQKQNCLNLDRVIKELLTDFVPFVLDSQKDQHILLV